MRRNDRSSVEEDGGLEHFADMDNAERKRADRDNVHANADILGIETTDKELLAIETNKAWAQRRSCSSGITKSAVWSGVTSLSFSSSTFVNQLGTARSVHRKDSRCEC